MEEAKNGVIDLTDRILKELLKKPGFKDSVRTILQNIDSESGRSLVRTVMWKDPEMFLALLGALPAFANALIRGIDELLIQLKEKFSPELLHDFVKSIVLEIDRESIESIIQNGKGLTMDRIKHCVGAGYGRKQISFANVVESEIACHGKGAQWHMSSIRMVIDIGGQDAKAIRLDDKGNVVRYVYNDKCASGTGRFLEVMAEALGVNLSDMGTVSLESKNPISMSNQCGVFAETEVISLINEGRPPADLISGLHKALAHRVAALAKSIELEEDITMTGGVAKNIGMFDALEKALGKPIKRLASDSQINGALGAALFALEALRGGKAH